jgi:hypothetical protein
MNFQLLIWHYTVENYWLMNSSRDVHINPFGSKS